MYVTNLSIRYSTTVYSLIVVIIIFGLASYFSLPREAAPDIPIPFIIVSTVYIGVSPADMENLVTRPIEKEIKGLENIKQITSASGEGFSMIIVEFNPKADLDDALQKVKDRVDRAKGELPDDAEEPLITDIAFSDFPIMLINISGNYGLEKLKDLAEDLQDLFETIPGVQEAKIAGGLEREVKVNVDPQKMKFYNLGFQDIKDTIAFENINIPGGTIDIGEYKYLVKVPGELADPHQINNLVITFKDNHPVYIKDVANVVYGFKERATMARMDGRESVTIQVQKRAGENLIRIADEIKNVLARETPGFPLGTGIVITSDQSKDIRDFVKELENNIISGIVLVVIAIFLFLGFRNSFFVALAIPFSMLISFTIIHIMGVTLNMVVLFSLILALGMLVDNAIVIVENIYRHRQEGKSRLEAAKFGTHEVGGPVIASTITTCAAFSPMLFWPDVIGEFMKFLPMTLIITLLSSLFVGLVINPVLCASFMKVKSGALKTGTGKKDAWIIRWYKTFLEKALAHPYLTIFMALLVLVMVILLFGSMQLGVEFFPDVIPQKVFINVKAPSGTRLEVTDELTHKIEKVLPPIENIKHYVVNVGSGGTSEGDLLSGGGGAGIPNQAGITIDFKEGDEQTESTVKTVQDLRNHLKGFSGADFEVVKEEMGPPTGAPVSIEITGDDFKLIGKIARDIRDIIKPVNGLVDLRDDFSKGRPEIKVIVDREKAAKYGIRTMDISSTVRTAVYGDTTTEYRVSEDEYDITVRLDQPFRNSIKHIEQLNIFHEGTQIPLTAVATVKLSSGYTGINRKNLKRVVTIFGDVEGRLANDVLADVQKVLGTYKLPRGYTISYTGEQEEQNKASAFLMKAFLVAIFLIGLILITQFNSVLLPFIIMISVILSIIGVLLGLIITNTPFGIIMTGIGVISLAGVVVNNAIVFLDYILKLRQRGLDRVEAIVTAGKTRFRPVMLTAVTTILGLIPLTTGISLSLSPLEFVINTRSSQWWGPMGVAVIFGLAFSTILTLVVVPVLYYLIDRMTEWFKLKLGFGQQTSG